MAQAIAEIITGGRKIAEVIFEPGIEPAELGDIHHQIRGALGQRDYWRLKAEEVERERDDLLSREQRAVTAIDDAIVFLTNFLTRHNGIDLDSVPNSRGVAAEMFSPSVLLAWSAFDVLRRFKEREGPQEVSAPEIHAAQKRWRDVTEERRQQRADGVTAESEAMDPAEWPSERDAGMKVMLERQREINDEHAARKLLAKWWSQNDGVAWETIRHMPLAVLSAALQRIPAAPRQILIREVMASLPADAWKRVGSDEDDEDDEELFATPLERATQLAMGLNGEDRGKLIDDLLADDRETVREAADSSMVALLKEKPAHMQYEIAKALASNVGYVLKEEPSPDGDGGEPPYDPAFSEPQDPVITLVLTTARLLRSHFMDIIDTRVSLGELEGNMAEAVDRLAEVLAPFEVLEDPKPVQPPKGEPYRAADYAPRKSNKRVDWGEP
jgi:hypothetical protein